MPMLEKHSNTRYYPFVIAMFIWNLWRAENPQQRRENLSEWICSAKMMLLDISKKSEIFIGREYVKKNESRNYISRTSSNITHILTTIRRRLSRLVLATVLSVVWKFANVALGCACAKESKCWQHCQTVCRVAALPFCQKSQAFISICSSLLEKLNNTSYPCDPLSFRVISSFQIQPIFPFPLRSKSIRLQVSGRLWQHWPLCQPCKIGLVAFAGASSAKLHGKPSAPKSRAPSTSTAAMSKRKVEVKVPRLSAPASISRGFCKELARSRIVLWRSV